MFKGPISKVMILVLDSFVFFSSIRQDLDLDLVDFAVKYCVSYADLPFYFKKSREAVSAS